MADSSDRCNETIIERADGIGPKKKRKVAKAADSEEGTPPQNKGTLKIDATVAE